MQRSQAESNSTSSVMFHPGTGSGIGWLQFFLKVEVACGFWVSLMMDWAGMEPQNRKSEDWQVILHPCQGAECYVTAANHHGYSNALVKRRAWLQLIVSTCGMLGEDGG